MDRTLAAAFIDNRAEPWHPARQRVLGARLRPFCLWHRFLLKSIDSPVFTGGMLDLRSLRTAAGICRLRFGQCQVRKPWPGAYLFRHGLQGEADRFYAYAGDYITKPEWAVVPLRPAKKGAAAPEPRGVIPEDIQIVADLVAWSHWPEWYVWELPISRAYWYQMMAHRAAGLDVDYVDEDERRFQEDLKAGLAKNAEAVDGAEESNGGVR